MNKAGSQADVIRPAIDWVPACQWSFNQELCFHYVGGDSDALFHFSPAELVQQHVSKIDSDGNWERRIRRIFSEEGPFDLSAPSPAQPYSIVHVPVYSAGMVSYAAGFAFNAGQPQPSPFELELTGQGVLQVLETERARMERFLHDVIAQCLSSTGLQLELMKLDAEKQDVELPDRAREVQRSLEEALERIRRFNTHRMVQTP